MHGISFFLINGHHYNVYVYTRNNFSLSVLRFDTLVDFLNKSLLSLSLSLTRMLTYLLAVAVTAAAAEKERRHLRDA
jgi:hypothetical protein